MREMKKKRLRQLVAWGHITQEQANQLYRNFLWGIIPAGEIPTLGK